MPSPDSATALQRTVLEEAEEVVQEAVTPYEHINGFHRSDWHERRVMLRSHLVNPSTEIPTRVLSGRDLQKMLQEGHILLMIQSYQDIYSKHLLQHIPPLDVQRGFEGLVRGIDERGQIIGAGPICRTARAEGMMGAISERILHMSCKLGGLMQEHQKLQNPKKQKYVSVNLPQELAWNPRLDAKVFAALHASGLEPENLTLEFLEENHYLPEDCVRSLRSLTRAGVKIAVDDFGEETSVPLFDQLRSYGIPIDTMKLKGNLFRDIHTKGEFVEKYLRWAEDAKVSKVVCEGFPGVSMRDVHLLRAYRDYFDPDQEWLFQGRVVPEPPQQFQGANGQEAGYYTTRA